MKTLLLVPFLALAATPAAQDEATTLARLADRAAHIVVGRVVASIPDGHGDRVVTFRTLELLRGDVGAQWTLREPDGDACGRALRGLLPGAACIAFLDAAEPAALVVPGPRAIPLLDPELRAQLRTLLATPDEAARLGLFAAALQSGSARVRADAAESLAQSRLLATAGANVRNLVAQALAPTLQRPAPETPALLRVAAQLRLDAAIAPLLDSYLSESESVLDPLLLRSLARLDPLLVVHGIAVRTASDEPRRLRAVPLLELLPEPQARGLLLGWCSARNPELVRSAAAALRRAGVHDPRLQALVPEPAAQPRPRFRVLRPEAVR